MVRTYNVVSTVHMLLIILFDLLGPASYLQAIKPVSCIESLTLRCPESERTALLSFKEGLKDPRGRLISWVGDDCCNWAGVGCDKNTGHVIKLNLQNSFPVSEALLQEDYEKSYLGGNISSSLLDLKYLSYLDLSNNNFNFSKIPKFLGSLNSLRYLNLSKSFFAGDIPPHLGNLSKLQYLDLNSIYTNAILEVKSLQWLNGFPSLKYLNLGGVNLEEVKDWLNAVNMLPSLLELHLPYCQLTSPLQSIMVTNFSLLSVLDLSINWLESSIPPWLGNLSELSNLNLEHNMLNGTMPNGFGHLVKLQSLELSGNGLIVKIPYLFASLCNLQTLTLAGTKIVGEIVELVDALSRCCINISWAECHDSKFHSLPQRNLETLDLSSTFIKGIPESIGNLSSLQSLDLSNNHMRGVIPKSMGKLSNLVSLHLEENLLEGVITNAHFQNLIRLQTLYLSQSISSISSLVLNIKHDWVPPFNLRHIILSNLQVGPNFPLWLKGQKELTDLVLNNVGISDTIPYDLSNSHPNVISWDLAYNKLHGYVPHLKFSPSIYYFDLSFNNFEGPLPIFPSNVSMVFLSNNRFLGPIPENINELLPKVQWLDLSSNLITGRIPRSIGMLKALRFLVLRNNSLSGKLPSQWKDLQSLEALDLAENNISGSLPRSMQYLSKLNTLSLYQNQFQGEIPSFFKSYRYMVNLDLGGNKFFGKLPTWVGESLSHLSRLSLRSNLFFGEIPRQLCLFSNLRILDIAHNEFSGTIPPCIMNSRNHTSIPEWDKGQMDLVWRGREDAYKSLNLQDFFSIDFSKNNLSGEIPNNITNLLELLNLNLSRNHLTGRIPENIGNLHVLESLDLSENKLFGHIPESLSQLNFLSHLNLSFNNFSGRIPQGNQLQTLVDFSIYEGIPFLCGPPLLVNCSKNEIESKAIPISKNGTKLLSFYIGMVVGFIVGFCGVCGILILKRTWRQAYFGFFKSLKEYIIVFVLVKVVGLLRKVKEETSEALEKWSLRMI